MPVIDSFPVFVIMYSSYLTYMIDLTYKTYLTYNYVSFTSGKEISCFANKLSTQAFQNSEK